MDLPDVVTHDLLEASASFIRAGLDSLPERVRLEVADLIETGQVRVQARVTLAPLEVHLVLIHAQGVVEVGRMVGNDG